MTKTTLIALTVMLMVLAGCASSPGLQTAPGALSITHMTTAIGGDNPEEQRISYSITIVNGSGTEIAIKTLQPVLSDQFARRSSAGNTAVIVDKTLEPQESLTVTGEVSFDAKGVSKQEVVGWGPAVLGAKVGSEVELKAAVGPAPTPGR